MSPSAKVSVWRLAFRGFLYVLGGLLKGPREAGGGIQQGGWGPIVQASREGRSRELVRCGVTVRCSALWGVR